MKKRIVCLTLALMMTATQVVSVSASREDELREEQAATSAQLDATYAQIDQLYSAKQQLQDEINSLDANLVNVMVSIQTLEGDISNKEADIQQTQADLQKAQNAKDKQYAACLLYTSKFICEDVFELLPKLEEEGEKYDVVILDPPAFTKDVYKRQVQNRCCNVLYELWHQTGYCFHG